MRAGALRELRGARQRCGEAILGERRALGGEAEGFGGGVGYLAAYG